MIAQKSITDRIRKTFLGFKVHIPGNPYRFVHNNMKCVSLYNRKRERNLLMGRMCERTDYMEALIYLFSDASAMMTGSTFRITAGEYI